MVDKSKKPNIKEIGQLERSVDILYQAACYFKQHFMGREMTYVTENRAVKVRFYKTQYMHLCGIQYDKGTSKFFDDCIEKRINLEAIKIKSDGTTMQKLQILKFVHELTGSTISLTSKGRYLHLEFDYALRTRKQIFALTLKETKDKLAPQSLLNLKVQREFPKGEMVKEIYSIDLYTQEKSVYYCHEDLCDK